MDDKAAEFFIRLKNNINKIEQDTRDGKNYSSSDLDTLKGIVMRDLKVVKEKEMLSDDDYDKIMMLRSKRAKYTGELDKTLPKSFREELVLLESSIADYYKCTDELTDTEFDYDPDTITFTQHIKADIGHTYGFHAQ
jgi:hypothetical protein